MLRTDLIGVLAGAAMMGLMHAAAASPDPAVIDRVTDQAFNYSQIAQTAGHLTDRIGARLTNSPGMREAELWTQARLKEWGLSNVRAEGFRFGRGWWIESSSARMAAPRPLALRSIPIAWTPATNGPLSAPIIVAPMTKESDFAAWRGKLDGKIVLVSFPRPLRDNERPAFEYLSDADIAALDQVEQPNLDPRVATRNVERAVFTRRLDGFLKAEGALAWARMGQDNGLIDGEAYQYQIDNTPVLPAVEIAAEDYRRLARLAKTGPVTLELVSNVHYDDADPNAYNILADLPGRDPKAGYVMAGAHLDSWFAADGATDNGAGVVIVMEAARILKAIGAKPKRTIRFALWAGEEQGMLGSLAYVQTHLATRPSHSDVERRLVGPYFSDFSFPITLLPGYRDFAGYFNVDSGSGKLRGLTAEGNFSAMRLLRQWLAPLGPLGAGNVVAGHECCTDHMPFQSVGLPGFAFIQDLLDYRRTHHSSVDTYDHLRMADLRQGAAVLATVLLAAADSNEVIAPMPVPTQPQDDDPFRYDDPAQR